MYQLLSIFRPIVCRPARILGMALVLASLAIPVNASQTTEGKRIALVIGNANYKENPLANPVNDAKAMCSTLKGLGFDTACIYDIQDKRKFIESVQSFARKLNPQTISLFYYAGHGMQINGENFLIPTQAELKSPVDVTWEALSVQQIMDYLEVAKSQFSLAILDACRNNPWSRRWRSRGMPMEDGLASPISQPRGSIIMYATRDKEVASDGADGNGLFTKHLLANIRTEGISVEQMIKRVTRGVEEESERITGRAQTPGNYSQFSGEFCFAGCAPDSSRLMEQVAALSRQLEQANRERQKNMVAVKDIAAIEAERDTLLKRIEQVQQQGASSSKDQQRQKQELLELQARIQDSDKKIQENDMLARKIQSQEAEITELNRRIIDLNDSLTSMAKNSKASQPVNAPPPPREFSIAAPL